jgi:hypothetical protein
MRMSEEAKGSEPPQITYFVVFSLAILFLAISMVQYPLWNL